MKLKKGIFQILKFDLNNFYIKLYNIKQKHNGFL